ncbi:MAG: cytochrome b/b6 domain-containing protein [Bacteroidales bacterium]|nr:cytochrome b/b6 domain-containing protein [Bacteroidales bacterium]
MSEKVYLYPVWIRFWHWTNAFLCLLLIVTGISMQYSDPSFPMIRFDWSVSIHNTAGVLLAMSYLFFLLGNMVTSNGKHYVFRKGILKNLWAQARFYAFGIFKGENPPFPISVESKFNPLQKLSYIVIMHLAIPIVAISGVMLLYPEIIANEFFGSKALHTTDIFHVVMGFTVSLFLIVHLYFCTIGHTPTSNFKGMINGFHEKH